jgi:type I restriction enzyme S subunit
VNGWTRLKLSACVRSVTPGKSVNSLDGHIGVDGIGVLKTSAVSSGVFKPHEHKRVAVLEVEQARTPVKAGTIVVCRSNTAHLVGSSAIVAKGNPRLFLSDKLWAIEPAVGVDASWLHQYLSLPRTRRLMREEASGSAAGMKNISQVSFLDLPVELPPFPEQVSIAKVLGTWDEAIETALRLVELKRLEFDSLRRKLLSASGGSNAHWELKPLNEISTRVRRRSDHGDHPVMTIASKSGFVLQSDKYSREMAGTSLETYVMLRENEFAYNKGNSLTFPQGCVFSLERKVALVPHVYFCFALAPGLHRDFYRHVFDAGFLNRQLSQRINSGVRNNGLLNINAQEFFECELPVPSRDEQVKIANVLSAAKEEIALLERVIAALKQQKHGLMQKLLTGEWRTNVGDAA